MWHAILGVIDSQNRWKVLEQDPSGGWITFNTGLSWSSWSGQDVTVQVADAGNGQTHVTAGGKIARRGLASAQLISWGEKGRLVKSLLAGLDAALGAPAR